MHLEKPNSSPIYPDSSLHESLSVRNAAQKRNITIIITIHKLLFVAMFVTDIRTLVTTLLFMPTVLTSVPLWARLAVWGCLGNQEPTRRLPAPQPCENFSHFVM